MQRARKHPLKEKDILNRICFFDNEIKFATVNIMYGEDVDIYAVTKNLMSDHRVRVEVMISLLSVFK